jgi:hypothetical protein
MSLLPSELPLEAGKKRHVFIVDDHPLVREWLTNLINRQEDLMVCGDAEDAPEALRAMERLKPDIAVIDLTLPSGSGMNLIKDLQRVYPRMQVLVLSMHDESVYAERALRAGARGYVMKSETTKKIISALREILLGGIYVSAQFKDVLTGRLFLKEAESSVEKQLSERELEVFKMLGKGMETKRIAEAMRISIKTVQVYCARIKEKRNLANITELLREAVLWSESAGNAD